MKTKILMIVGLILTGPAIFAGDDSLLQIQPSFNMNVLWVILCAALVFFMQAGFKSLEAGMVKKEHRDAIGVKNLIDWIVGGLVFFIIGFGFMFGSSSNGIIGTDFFMGLGLFEHNEGLTVPGVVFFLFQLGFAGTALTIISGAMSGRVGLMPYVLGSVITALIIYPVFGHWVWGDLFVESNTPWLANLGFIDFAGSTVVHSTGAWVSLVGIWMLGPRIGRFDENGKPKNMKSSNYAYAILGVMILWLGWWGFNGGSTLEFNNDIGKILLNTNLAAITAGLSAFLFCYFFQNREDLIEKLIGGTLGGLVAITAGCHLFSPMSSIAVGILAGIVHNLGYDLLLRLKLDDPVGAIPVHGFCGVLGTLCVGIFMPGDMLSMPRLTQIMVQLTGVIVCFGFAATVSFFMFKFLKSTIGLRVSVDKEIKGVFVENKSFDLEKYLINKEKNENISYVSIQKAGGGYNLIGLETYLKMSILLRKKLVMDRKVDFLDKTGNSIPYTDVGKKTDQIVELKSIGFDYN